MATPFASALAAEGRAQAVSSNESSYELKYTKSASAKSSSTAAATTVISVPGIWAAVGKFKVTVSGDSTANVTTRIGGQAKTVAPGVNIEAWSIVHITHGATDTDAELSIHVLIEAN